MNWKRTADEPPPIGVPVFVRTGERIGTDCVVEVNIYGSADGPTIFEGERRRITTRRVNRMWDNGATRDPNGMPAPLSHWEEWALGADEGEPSGGSG